MANKQSLPNITSQHQPSLMRGREIPVLTSEVSAETDGFSAGLDLIGSALAQTTALRKQLKMADYSLKADETLENYRNLLKQTENIQDFQNIEHLSERDLKQKFTDNSDEFAKDFWKEHGQPLLQAHRQDVADIKVAKESEFGKRNIQDVLGQAQQMISQASADKAQYLLEYGENLIQNSPFLSAEEKEVYQDNYLYNGILNMALGSPETALQAQQKYFKDNTVLAQQLADLKEIQVKDLKAFQNAQKRDTELNTLRAENEAWYQLQNKEISPAEYFVLNPNHYRADKVNTSHSLGEVYEVLKRRNNGEQLSLKEIVSATEGLRQAYDTHSLNLAHSMRLQNELLQEKVDEQALQLDAYIDNLCGADAIRMRASQSGRSFLDEKAKLAFDVYQKYYQTEDRLHQKAEAKNGEDADVQQAQVWTDFKTSSGYVEDFDVSFAKLNHAVTENYDGGQVAEIWQRYFKQAPMVKDKIGLVQKIASDLQNEELNYPRFYSADELRRAHLNVGDKFYFQGKLAVMKG